MPRIVDGDNLLGTWPGRSRSDDEKRALARQVDRLTRRERRPCLLVFDGTAPQGVALAAEVVFSGAGRSADALIVDRLRAAADPRGWTVVTQDRALADRCRALGASIEPPRAFRERLTRATGGEKPEDGVDVAYWLEEFGGEPE